MLPKDISPRRTIIPTDMLVCVIGRKPKRKPSLAVLKRLIDQIEARRMATWS